MRFAAIAITALAASAVSATSDRVHRRDDLDDYQFPQQCQTQCAGVAAFRDGCRQKNMDIEDDDDKQDTECSVCNLIKAQGAADCYQCLLSLQNPPDNTDDVVDDMQEAMRDCPGMASQSGMPGQSQSAMASQSQSDQGTIASATSQAGAAGSSAAAAVTGSGSGAGAKGLSAGAVLVAVVAAVAL